MMLMMISNTFPDPNYFPSNFYQSHYLIQTMLGIAFYRHTVACSCLLIT